MDVGSDGLDRPGDIAQVGFMVLIERGRHADDNGIYLGDL